jgi:hypothetical protein
MYRIMMGLMVVWMLSVPAFAQVAFWQNEWPNTDFQNSSVDTNDILSGGPAKDGIPAIDAPQMIAIDTETRLGEREPVMTVELPGQQPRAYPIRYLMFHEIVNDTIGTIPVAVTFCPLCNSGITFDRRVNGNTLDFGVTGKLRNSDMIMFDRQTESWWQQFQGRGIIGDMNNVKLNRLASWMESWSEFKKRNPQGVVMDQPDANRPYGTNPYVNYDSGNPFLYQGENPPHGIKPLERVVVVGDRAWPLARLRDAAEITENGLRITWRAGTASALDKRNIAKARDVGSIRVYDALSGENMLHDVSFAFAFHAFYPNGKWMLR